VQKSDKDSEVGNLLSLGQIPSEAEIAGAVLVQKPSGYYLHVTCYLLKENTSRQFIGQAIAIDFGVHTKLTLSNGVKIDFEFQETESLKTLQRKFQRTEKNSKNRKKLRFLLRKKYEKLVRRRRDVHNRVLAFLKGYKEVVFQDDFVKGWDCLFGGQVHSSGVGGLKARLSSSLATPSLVQRYEPTTKECFACGRLHELSLGDRILGVRPYLR